MKNDAVLTCRSVWAISVLFSLQEHISPSFKPGLKSWSSLLHYFYLQSKINIIFDVEKNLKTAQNSRESYYYITCFYDFFFALARPILFDILKVARAQSSKSQLKRDSDVTWSIYAWVVYFCKKLPRRLFQKWSHKVEMRLCLFFIDVGCFFGLIFSHLITNICHYYYFSFTKFSQELGRKQ